MEKYTQLSFDFMIGFEDTGKFVGKVGIFKTKVCTVCNNKLEATRENFHFHATGLYNLTSICKTCKAKNSRKLFELKDSHLCRSCSNSRLENSDSCLYHHIYFVLKTQQRNGRFEKVKTKQQLNLLINQLILKLENQNYKCAITGEKLEVGVNASLDHILEKCNGGSCELENLQWVTKKANTSKPRKYKND